MLTAQTVNEQNLEQAVLSALKYFSIFQYPLTIAEIRKYAPMPCSMPDIHEILAELKLTNRVFSYRGYYSTGADIAWHVGRRVAGNRLAAEKMHEAFRTGAFIANFPFVRFVGISGSLSKDMADEQCDFDFFIITAANRLWICRTILHLFKKLTFITGAQHKYCMNYFVDEGHTSIEEKNIFTAVELATLYPVSGRQAFEMLKQNNRWAYNFLPNSGFRDFERSEKGSNGLLKRFEELCLNAMAPLWLNRKLMTATDKRWRKKWFKKNYPAEDYDLAFKTTIYISKNHPANHQKKILKCLEGLRQS